MVVVGMLLLYMYVRTVSRNTYNQKSLQNSTVYTSAIGLLGIHTLNIE